MSITPEVEHHDFDMSNYISRELCKEEVEPTNLEFDDDILSIEYEYFSCGFEINESFDEVVCALYESFSFDPTILDLSFASRKSEFVGSENIATKNFDLDQTLTHIKDL